MQKPKNVFKPKKIEFLKKYHNMARNELTLDKIQKFKETRKLNQLLQLAKKEVGYSKVTLDTDILMSLYRLIRSKEVK